MFPGPTKLPPGGQWVWPASMFVAEIPFFGFWGVLTGQESGGLGGFLPLHAKPILAENGAAVRTAPEHTAWPMAVVGVRRGAVYQETLPLRASPCHVHVGWLSERQVTSPLMHRAESTTCSMVRWPRSISTNVWGTTRFFLFLMSMCMCRCVIPVLEFGLLQCDTPTKCHGPHLAFWCTQCTHFPARCNLKLQLI